MSTVYALMTIHNRRELTLACLDALAEQTYSDLIVVVVNDGSTDGSGQAIKEKFPKTIILTGDGNLWWTRGMNKGLAYILPKAMPGDYVFTLNDDTQFDTDYIEKLVATAKRYPHTCVGSLLRNLFQPTVIEDSGVQLDWNGYIYKRIMYDPIKTEVVVDTLPCRGTLIPVEVFRSIGIFNQRWLPHYAADYEFFIRAKRAGFGLLMSYQAVVYNKDHLDAPAKPKKSLWWRAFNMKSVSNIKNTFYIILKYSPTWKLKIKNTIAFLHRATVRI